MRLLDKPYTREQKDNILRMLDGCICRVCVSDDLEEVIRMAGFAHDYISELAYSRAKQIRQENSLSCD